MNQPGFSVIGKVCAPGMYANSQLNGSECIVVHRSPDTLTVLLLSGRSAGREWQLCPAHVVFPLRPPVTETRRET